MIKIIEFLGPIKILGTEVLFRDVRQPETRKFFLGLIFSCHCECKMQFKTVNKVDVVGVMNGDDCLRMLTLEMLDDV
jgi:hypothetical protein